MKVMGRLLALGLASALAVTACSGSDTTESAESNGLEKTTLTVGIVPVPDSAPVFIAQERGFFKEEGLTIKTETIASTTPAIPKLVSGAMDIALGNYFSVFDVQQKRVGDFRFLTDSYQAKPDCFVIVTKKDSPIQSVKDLEGKKIAVPALNAIPTLAVDNVLRLNGVKIDHRNYVPIPFPQMPAALEAGQVDAAWMTEPTLTAAQKDMGARKITDTMIGPMADFPIAGWVTTADAVKKYPKTMAAFQRAISKALQIAGADRKSVEKVLPNYTQIKPDAAAVIAMGTYPSSLNATRIQRVADTMFEYGYLKEKLDVTPLLLPIPSTSK